MLFIHTAAIEAAALAEDAKAEQDKAEADRPLDVADVKWEWDKAEVRKVTAEEAIAEGFGLEAPLPSTSWSPWTNVKRWPCNREEAYLLEETELLLGATSTVNYTR